MQSKLQHVTNIEVYSISTIDHVNRFQIVFRSLRIKHIGAVKQTLGDLIAIHSCDCTMAINEDILVDSLSECEMTISNGVRSALYEVAESALRSNIPELAARLLNKTITQTVESYKQHYNPSIIPVLVPSLFFMHPIVSTSTTSDTIDLCMSNFLNKFSYYKAAYFAKYNAEFIASRTEVHKIMIEAYVTFFSDMFNGVIEVKDADKPLPIHQVFVKQNALSSVPLLAKRFHNATENNLKDQLFRCM